jgi:hypothetical protein
VTRGDIAIHLLRHRGKVKVEREWVLEQLVDVENYVLTSLELLGDKSGEQEDPKSLLALLEGVLAKVVAARAALRGERQHRMFPFHAVDPKVDMG